MSLYHILDAARLGFDIRKAMALNPTFDSLYRGQSKELLATISPYLFQYESGSEFDTWLKENYGLSWGIGIVSDAPMEVIHKHFRKFLLVKEEDGRELYFRFYDPRVLRTFLPTCSTAQLNEFFGPIQQFIVENPAHKQMLLFEYKNDRLEIQKRKFIPISDPMT